MRLKINWGKKNNRDQDKGVGNINKECASLMRLEERDALRAPAGLLTVGWGGESVGSKGEEGMESACACV